MACAKLFEYLSAERGYHYYRRYWQPQTQQKLACVHEKDNPYDFFAIKMTDITSRMTVGHLPMENFRVTKFLLDRGARVFAILKSTNCCLSPLVQGGLEIPCRIEIHLPPTVKNKELIRIYESYVDTLYYQREEANIICSFLESEEVPASGKQQGDKAKPKKK